MTTVRGEIQAPERFFAFVDEVVGIVGTDQHRLGVAAQVAGAVRQVLQDEETYAWLCGEATKYDFLHHEEDMGFAILVSDGDSGLYREPHDHGPCWAVNGTLAGATRLRHYQQAEPSSPGGKVGLRLMDEVLCDARKVDCTEIGIAHELLPVEAGPSLAVRCHDVRTVVQNRYDLEKGTYRVVDRARNATVSTHEFEVLD